MLGRVIDLLRLTERECITCGKKTDFSGQGYVCDECLNTLKPYHPMDYTPLEWVSSYRVFGRYEGVLSDCIKALKFKSVKPLAKVLGRAMRSHLEEFLKDIEPDLLTYVPVHWRRRWSRGFDHNLEILNGAGIEAQRLLIRVKHSKPLAQMGKGSREKAVKDAFRVPKDLIEEVEGKVIFVFDDILTTGSTAKSVAETLMSLGALRVHFYFLARES